MKAHLGVDSRTKLIHAVAATPANTADSTVLPDLLHGKETRVWGDQAYRGQRAVIRQHAPKAQDFTNRRYHHRAVVDEIERAKNPTKSKIRARANMRSGSSSGCSASLPCRTTPATGLSAPLHTWSHVLTEDRQGALATQSDLQIRGQRRVCRLIQVHPPISSPSSRRT